MRHGSDKSVAPVLDQSEAIEAEGGRDQRYVNWRVLGRGGTATVYRVLDTELECDVAIKLINQDILENVSYRKSMMKAVRGEVKISRALRHEYICPIHDLYDGPRGFGAVMDLVIGGELRGWMDLHQNALLATSAERFQLLLKLTEALAFAHTRIVHRDLKPQNIFIRDQDITRPVIMDFGFSVLGMKVDEDSSVAFTPKYMAPEQYTDPGQVDQRADLWALGIIAYELFTNRIPQCSLRDIRRTGKPPRVPIEQIEPPSAFNGWAPPALDQAIMQLLHYDRERRIPTAAELVAALKAIKPEVPKPKPQTASDKGRRADAVRVEGGEYWLGSPGQSKYANEKPRVAVVLSPFWIDPNPVTNVEYQAFVTATGHSAPPLADKHVASFARLPVVGVTYEDALAFARWCGGTLPTEAQWECAARAGVAFRAYPWGDDPPTATRANIARVSDTTTPVGSFPEGANDFGLFDMCGNVWEWCLDYYEEKAYAALVKGARNPENRRASPYRVLRGGSFSSFSHDQGRCAFRYWAKPGERSKEIGFRVVYRDEGTSPPSSGFGTR